MDYTFQDAAEECAHKANASKTPIAKQKKMTLGLYQELWQSLLKWIVTTFDTGRGINIPFLMKITWRQEINMEENSRVLRPVFILADGFIRSHNVMLKYRLKKEELNPTNLGKAEEINFAKIAMRYSQHLSKDQVFTGTRKMFNRIGHAIAEGRRVRIDFGIGELVSSERKVEFVFAPDFLKRTLVADQNGNVKALESFATDNHDVNDENDEYGSQYRHDGTRTPSGRSGIASTMDIYTLSPTDDLRKIKQDITNKRSEMAIEQAYERYAKRIDAQDKEAERAKLQQLEILRRAEEEEKRRSEMRKQALMSQAEYIKSEIARKQEERKRSRMDQRSEIGITLETKPGSVMAFPVEPDPIPLAKAKKREQEKLKSFLLTQVESKQRQSMEMREREAYESKSMLNQIEEDMQMNYLQQATLHKLKLEDLNRERAKQLQFKQMQQTKAAHKLMASVSASPSPTLSRGATPVRPQSVGMRTFELMSHDQLRGAVGATPVFTNR